MVSTTGGHRMTTGGQTVNEPPPSCSQTPSRRSTHQGRCHTHCMCAHEGHGGVWWRINGPTHASSHRDV
eukprot:6412231-Prymnesium_polylepis.1